MYFQSCTVVFVLLWTQVLSKEDSPTYKRSSRDASVNDISYLGKLSQRNACSDAFGENAQNSKCADSQTLCCTREEHEYPACEKYLGKGWCCIEEDAGCYVNQKSVCDEDGSVLCTNLQSGTDKACCPKLTTCDPGMEASKDSVRCHISRKDLLSAAKAQESSKPGSRTAKSNLATSDRPSPDAPQNSLTGSAIAGIVLGAMAGGLIIASLVFWLLKRNGRAEVQTPKQLMTMNTSTLRTRTRGRGIGRKSWAHWEDIDHLQN